MVLDLPALRGVELAVEVKPIVRAQAVEHLLERTRAVLETHCGHERVGEPECDAAARVAADFRRAGGAALEGRCLAAEPVDDALASGLAGVMEVDDLAHAIGPEPGVERADRADMAHARSLCGEDGEEGAVRPHGRRAAVEEPLGDRDIAPR